MTKKPDPVDPADAAADEAALLAELEGSTQVAAPPSGEDAGERLHPILSNEEVVAVRERARKRVDKERRDTAAELLLADEVSKIKREEGLVTGSEEDELEHVFLDLAEHSDRITLNGVVYFHGRGYDVPRHVARTMKEIQFRGWQHQIVDIDGKSRRDFYRRSYDTRLGGSGAVVGGMTAAGR